MEIAKKTKVRLISFSGTTTPKKSTEPQNNYWKLIGQKGEIINGERFNERVLVLFDEDLDQFGVANHNPIINSLWILPSDLELQDT